MTVPEAISDHKRQAESTAASGNLRACPTFGTSFLSAFGAGYAVCVGIICNADETDIDYTDEAGNSLTARFVQKGYNPIRLRSIDGAGTLTAADITIMF